VLNIRTMISKTVQILWDETNLHNVGARNEVMIWKEPIPYSNNPSYS